MRQSKKFVFYEVGLKMFCWESVTKLKWVHAELLYDDRRNP